MNGWTYKPFAGVIHTGGDRCGDNGPIAAATVGLTPLERSTVGRDKMLAEVPLVLDHLLADRAGHALRLYVHIDNVLLQVEAIGEGLPAVVADTRLHAAPPVPRVGDPNTCCGGGGRQAGR